MTKENLKVLFYTVVQFSIAVVIFLLTCIRFWAVQGSMILDKVYFFCGEKLRMMGPASGTAGPAEPVCWRFPKKEIDLPYSRVSNQCDISLN